MTSARTGPPTGPQRRSSGGELHRIVQVAMTAEMELLDFLPASIRYSKSKRPGFTAPEVRATQRSDLVLSDKLFSYLTCPLAQM